MSQEAEDQIARELEKQQMEQEKKELEKIENVGIVSDLALIDEIVAEGEAEDAEELDPEFLDLEDDDDDELGGSEDEDEEPVIIP